MPSDVRALVSVRCRMWLCDRCHGGFDCDGWPLIRLIEGLWMGMCMATTLFLIVVLIFFERSDDE